MQTKKANTYSIRYLTSCIVGIGLKVARKQTSLVYNVALFLLARGEGEKEKKESGKKGMRGIKSHSWSPSVCQIGRWEARLGRRTY